MAAAMATGEVWLKVPEAIRFHLIGKPSEWVGGKDIIFFISSVLPVWTAACTIPWNLPGTALIPDHGRSFTIANMAIEAGAKKRYF
jgi:3-isopropylmalate/(R)-2-methylmalate dehydratase large subunit